VRPIAANAMVFILVSEKDTFGTDNGVQAPLDAAPVGAVLGLEKGGKRAYIVFRIVLMR
jgi:hypothetical protein